LKIRVSLVQIQVRAPFSPISHCFSWFYGVPNCFVHTLVHTLASESSSTRFQNKICQLNFCVSLVSNIVPMKNLGKLKEYWTSYSIPRWPSFDETKELKLNNLEEISIWLTAQVNIPSEVYLWNLVKLKQFIQRIRFQKLVYDLVYLGTFFFTFLAILFFALTWIKTTLPHVTLTWVSLLAILPCFFLKQELGRRHANVEIIDLLSDQLTKTQKNKLSNLIDECLSQRKRFYFVVNGNKIRTISEECLTTQNAFLFFTGEYSHRKGIMLSGSSYYIEGKTRLGDYYLKEANHTYWGGGAKDALNLDTGPIKSEDFDRLMQGYVSTEERIGNPSKDGEWNHNPGRDLTFSDPKSVSILMQGLQKLGLKDNLLAIKKPFGPL